MRNIVIRAYVPCSCSMWDCAWCLCSAWPHRKSKAKDLWDRYIARTAPSFIQFDRTIAKGIASRAAQLPVDLFHDARDFIITGSVLMSGCSPLCIFINRPCAAVHYLQDMLHMG